jgi:hypothetical protein
MRKEFSKTCLIRRKYLKDRTITQVDRKPTDVLTFLFGLNEGKENFF